MKLITALLLFLLASGVHSQPAEHCPVLPPDVKLIWSYQEGPDFGVCYAVEPSTERTAFGIYLGYAPKFEPAQEKSIGKGDIGGHIVKWYERSSFYITSDPAEFSQETVVKIDRNGMSAHVWVLATSDQELEQRLSILSKLRFR